MKHCNCPGDPCECGGRYLPTDSVLHHGAWAQCSKCKNIRRHWHNIKPAEVKTK